MSLIRPFIVLAIGLSVLLAGQTLLVPAYMLQIYSRVIPSNSVETLVALSLIAIIALALFGALEFLRRFVMARAAVKLEAHMAGRLMLSSYRDDMSQLGGNVSLMRDVAAIRALFSSPSFLALFDIPFIPLFVALLFYLHPLLGIVTLAGATVLIVVATLNQVLTKPLLEQQSRDANSANLDVYSQLNNVELIRAHGMYQEALNLWGRGYSTSLISYLRSVDRATLFDAAAKSIRLLIQMSLLGFGGYLVIDGHMSAGIVFAASIVGSRALAPIDQLIGGWRQLSQGRTSLRRVRDKIEKSDFELERTPMPSPVGRINVEKLIYAIDGNAILKGFSFSVEAGKHVAIIGPNGAGKTTLARLLVGAIQPTQGGVRIDGNLLSNWDPTALGCHMGYMPQTIEFIQGTVAENIARFKPVTDDNVNINVVDAARLVGAHDMIMAFPQGYDTIIGPGKFAPSGGQKQLIALARAFFLSPTIIVLDEPNSHLDQTGDQALASALAEARRNNSTVFVITQRPNVLQLVDDVLILKDGVIDGYGAKDEILPKLMPPVSRVQPAAATQGTTH